MGIVRVGRGRVVYIYRGGLQSVFLGRHSAGGGGGRLPFTFDSLMHSSGIGTYWGGCVDRDEMMREH